MSQDNNYSQWPRPSGGAERRGSTNICHVGAYIFSASMWTGGTLGTGLSYNDFFWQFSSVIFSSVFTLHFSVLSAQKQGSQPTFWRVTHLV